MGSISSIVKSNKRIFSVAAGVVVMFVVATLVLLVTEPYGVYADGTKVGHPYAIAAGENQIALVEDEKTAQTVISEVMDSYTPSGSQINEIVVDEQLSATEAGLSRGGDPELVLTGEEAVNYIKTANASDDPLFCVTVTSEQGGIQKIKADTNYEDTDKLYEGETVTKEAGSDGDKVVIVQTVSVNGEEVSTQIVDTTIIKEAIASLVYRGTVGKNEFIEGVYLGSGSGDNIASQGLRYVGNPYRYGGTSLTNGTDCSGFTQAIYRKYGIKLPRTSSAQRKVGKSVPLNKARKGDLVCYNGHVAIYIGGGKIVHAATPKKGICVSNVHSPGKIVTVRRILK